MWEYYIYKLNSSLTNKVAIDVRGDTEMRNTNILIFHYQVYLHVQIT